MNISIRKQLTLIFVGLMSAMFLANFLVNSFFLEDFYYMRKQNRLVKCYDMLEERLDNTGHMEQESFDEYVDYCNNNGILFVVTDSEFRKVMWMVNPYIDIYVGRLNGYGIGLDQDASIVEQSDHYTIQKKYDSAIGQNYMEMWGALDKDGKEFYFIFRMNIESIRESVRIANDFIKYICLIGVVLGACCVGILSQRVTRPLRELTELSKRMADLDFDAKYESGGVNEIAQLGEHFNEMSQKLESAYSELMTANNELQKDLEKKQQIDDMRKEFLSNVSHELKTPIALIQGYAEGLQECVNDDAESREFYCEVIMDEAAKMNGLVQKLLTLNQLEFGNDKVTMERFDIAELIRNKIQSVKILARQKEASIEYYGDETLAVWGDEFKTEEVLTNYLSNALNHVSGARRIEVRADRRPEVKCVRIRVFNTGDLIPEGELEKIWDKFYKVDKARTREYGGSGVGLSIVKAIMESFQQKNGVENREDGVEFWFELPCDGKESVEDGTCTVL